MLLIMGGQAQSLEPPSCSVVLNLLHQSSSITFPSLLLRHNHRLDEQAAAVTYNQRQPCVAQQTLRLFVAQQEDQADGELWTGFLEGVNPGGLASLPLRVDQVCTGNQQVRTPVDGNRTDLLRMLSVFLNILFLTV